MSKATITKCDVCGRLKGEGNKWIFLEQLKDGLKIPTNCTYDCAICVTGIILDICSETCLQKIIQETIGKQRNYPNAQESIPEPIP